MEGLNASCECELPGFKKIPPPPPLPFFLREQYLNEISAITTDNPVDFKNETFETCRLCHWASKLDSKYLSEMLGSIKTGNNLVNLEITKKSYHWFLCVNFFV